MFLHQLNIKPNTIKSYKIQGTKLKQIQHFLSWNKADIKYSCKSQLYKIWSNVTNNTTKMTRRHKNRFLLQFTNRFRYRFRNFRVNIRTFTFVYPSKIILLFMISLKRTNINIISFRLNGNRNRFSSLVSSSANFCFKLFTFLSYEENWFLKNSTNLTINSSFLRLANFNSSMKFLSNFQRFR